jgi:anti-sigma regulatory factor (Ser/Thr protein kinase)
MTVRKAFEASEASVGAARRFVTDMMSGAPAEVQDAVSVMVSELSTNALLHASGGFEVALDSSELSVSVSVTDRGDGTPVLQTPTFREPHGRGLRIVAALSDEWGVSAAPDGKSVWFRINLQDSGTTASTGGMAGAVTGAPAEARESTPVPMASSSINAQDSTGPTCSHRRTLRTRSTRADRLAVRCDRSDRRSVPDLSTW